MRGSLKLANKVAEAMLDKKAENVVQIDLRKLEDTVADFFVICETDTKIQINTIVQNVLKELKSDLKQVVWHKEGMDQKNWVLLDYVDVVVHVFLKEYREFYDLEGLWGDAKIKKIEN